MERVRADLAVAVIAIEFIDSIRNDGGPVDGMLSSILIDARNKAFKTENFGRLTRLTRCGWKEYLMYKEPNFDVRPCEVLSNEEIIKLLNQTDNVIKICALLATSVSSSEDLDFVDTVLSVIMDMTWNVIVYGDIDSYGESIAELDKDVQKLIEKSK